METPESNSTHSGMALVTSDRASNATTGAPSGGEQTEDEAEDEGAVELPPPMEEIHTHPLPTGPSTSPAPASTPPGANVEGVHAQLVSRTTPSTVGPVLKGHFMLGETIAVKYRYI